VRFSSERFSEISHCKLVYCVIGAVIYYVVIQIVLRMGLSTDDLKLLTALVVALFLGVPYWKKKYSERHVAGKGGSKCLRF